MAPSGDAELLATLAAEVQEQHGESSTVQAIVAHAADVIPEAQHVSLTVRQQRRLTTLASTSPFAEQLDQMQYALNEGPCVEAVLEGEWFRSGDIGHDPRWPCWGPQAAAEGARSLCSMRLLARGEPIGALNMYTEERGAFDDPEAIDLAALYAIHAAHALSTARLVTGLETAMGSRHTIGLAQGILIERYGLDAPKAFALLQRLSSTQNRKLRDLAEELVLNGDLAGLSSAPDA
jgi:GAF domain-containing protein